MKNGDVINLIDDFGDMIRMEPTTHTNNYIYIYVVDNKADVTLDIELSGEMAPTLREVAAFLRGENSRERKLKIEDAFKDTFEIEFETLPRRVYLYFGANDVDFSLSSRHAKVFDEMAEFLEGDA